MATTKKVVTKKTKASHTKTAKETKKVKQEEQKEVKPTKPLKCVWGVSKDPCVGEVRKIKLFSQFKRPIPVTICEHHLAQHMEIMLLNKNKFNMEEVLHKDASDIHREATIVKLAKITEEGLDP